MNIEGIKPALVHAKFLDVVIVGSNIPFAKTNGNTEVKAVWVDTPKETKAYSCEGKFVPMR